MRAPDPTSNLRPVPTVRAGIAGVRDAVRLAVRTAPRGAAAIGALAIVQALLPFASLWFTKLTVDAVVVAMRSPDRGAAFREVLLWAGAAAATVIAGRVVSALDLLVSDVFGARVGDRVFELVHEKALALDLACFERPATYDLLHRVQQDAAARPVRLVRGAVDVVRSAIGILASIGITAAFHPLAPVLLLVTAAPAAWARARRGRSLFHWSLERAPRARFASYLSSVLLGPAHAKEVRTFGFGRRLHQRLGAVRNQLRAEHAAMFRRFAGLQALLDIPDGIALFGLYGWIAWRTVLGAISLGDLTLHAQAAQRLAAGFGGMFGAMAAAVAEDATFFAGFRELMDLDPAVRAPRTPQAPPEGMTHALAFDDVSFTYPGATGAAITGVSLVVKAGEHVALVGRNGAGKTTLLKLACRLYDPSAGRVTIGGVDLRDLAFADLRRLVGALFQDFGRYDLTVRDNVSLGAGDADPATSAVDLALRASGADATVARLPDGTETTVGPRFEHARELSAGEWQKLALARLWMQDAPVILLDEPTSALDAKAEADFADRLATALRGRTAVIVSHRWSTVRAADRVVVLDGGRIIDDGPPAALIARDGPLRRLFGDQALRANGSSGRG